MFKYKNAMISMAVVAMLAACGGGGGDGDGTAGNGNGNGDGSGVPGGGSGQVASKEDTKFAGNMVLSQVLLGSDGAGVLTYDQFTSETSDDANNPGYGSYYPRDVIEGTNAPVAAVGYRLNYALPDTPATASVGRVAFELKDQATGANQEILQILVDKVRVSSDASGNVSFAVPQDAKMYLYAKTSDAKTTTVEIDAPSEVVKELPIADDPTSFGLMLDVDAAVTAAIQGTTDATKRAVLNSIKGFSAEPSAPFATSLSFSNLNIVTGAQSTPLVVKDIKVTGFNEVPGILNGGGIGGDKPGYIQITPVAE